MQKYDVWVYLPDVEGKEPVDEYVGAFEGYVSEIATAVLVLYPGATGISIQPYTDTVI